MKFKTLTNELRELNILCRNRTNQNQLNEVHNEFNWKMLKQFLQSRMDQNLFNDLLKLLNKFYDLSKRLVGFEKDNEYISLVAVTILKTLLSEKHFKIFFQSEFSVKYGLSSNESHIPGELFALTKEIEKHLSETLIEQLKLIDDNNFYDIIYGSNVQFGYRIKFNLHPHCEIEKASSIFFKYFENGNIYDNLTLKSLSQNQNLCAQSNNDCNTVYDCIENFKAILMPFANNVALPVEDLVENIKILLCSKKNDEELQNDMFELLGVEGFEIIAEVLSKRKELVRNFNKKDVAFSNDDKASPPKCNNIIDELLNNPCAALERKARVLGNDPKENMYKEVSTRFQSSAKNVRYPNVYDLNAELQKTASVMSGQKIYLPKTSIIKKTGMFESIELPADVKKSDLLKVERIKVNNLDDIGKMGFQGIKELNLIQSVVFPTAYGTNENLLISAPTGAGKTNIAMLTVLHEIRQNIGPGGKIKLDEFKIIYVAPMKALAAEMTANFGKRLTSLGITVRECTGDMQLTKQEISKTQMIVTTPEKYDVITRKSTGDTALVQLVKLIIIDEVHLLHEDRGSVIESIVARTLRQVESNQKVIRIVGLSATLPNYLDVAEFLKVNPEKGLFYFDSRFRPVPLHQTFVGIRGENIRSYEENLNEVCYQKMVEFLKKGQQVMIFVHARNETQRTAKFMRNTLKERGDIEYILGQLISVDFKLAVKKADRSRDFVLRDVFPDGLACHHAGMLRSDRSFVEQQFVAGNIRVLCCTATLAWGVNLPAHAVIIKGTQIYDAEQSSFVDLGILDVLQIFGRAGRPQFDKEGHGIIMTKHDKLGHYISLIMRSHPIESKLLSGLNENLNAEIALGTITNVEEAIQWLSYTYFYVRMPKNPLAYGLKWNDIRDDPSLREIRRNLIIESARLLDKAKLIRFDERNDYLTSTDSGRLASHYYIRFSTADQMEIDFRSTLLNENIIQIISRAHEFSQMKVRDDELPELCEAYEEAGRIRLIQDGATDLAGKVNILLQCYINRYRPQSFSLVSDLNFITQNAGRIARYMFEKAIRNAWAMMTNRLLQFCKSIEHQAWCDASPLWQFSEELNIEVITRLDSKTLSIEDILNTPVQELNDIIRYGNKAKDVKMLASFIPRVEIDTTVQPITRTILRLRSKITPKFKWNDKYHGTQMQNFWVWVEDPESDCIHYSEMISLSKKQVLSHETVEIIFAIPIFEPMPSMYLLRFVSDTWMGSDFTSAISFKNMILPELYPPNTDLLDLRPLPVSALKNEKYQQFYSYTHFNPIQTQVFHALYHSDTNVLLGAPTGSGKTVAAELAIFNVFNHQPKKKCVYIAPLKALVRERTDDWKNKFEKILDRKVVELTGDIAPDMKAVANSDLIVTTPEKWDGVSRSWQERKFVQDVALIIIDEIHLLGEDRGPIIEVIVSRINFISDFTKSKVRVVGLSTALANARDLADWLHIDINSVGLYNFRPSVRPVPLQVHIQGFTGRHYCPRMATMNKPIFQAIRVHSPDKPVLIFVSSRRQTRLTAYDLISFVVSSDDPHQWINLSHDEVKFLTENIRDQDLKLCISYGIGMHHAGLHEKDRKIIESLFLQQKIQILIATSTLAWGVNFPAHLVVLKGTEYFDGKTKRYIDYPITDVLQMMGRAGRPQFDDNGKAVIMVQDSKKEYYKKFLYEPFPVESNLPKVLPDHMNAEIVAGTITSKQSAMNYLTWTFFFRRLMMNPNYYDLQSVDHKSLNVYLSRMIETIVDELERSRCIEIDECGSLEPGIMGRIASYYYLKHNTMRLFHQQLAANSTLENLLHILTSSEEFAELPVRHNENQLNLDLSHKLPIKLDINSMDSPNTKANLLLQAYFSRIPLPITDYYTDTKSVLDQAIRIMQAIIDSAGSEGWLATCIRAVYIIQMIVQGLWITDNPLLQLPEIETHHLKHIKNRNNEPIKNLPELMDYVSNKYHNLKSLLPYGFDKRNLDNIFKVLCQYPVMEISLKVQGEMAESNNHKYDDVQQPYKPNMDHRNKKIYDLNKKEDKDDDVEDFDDKIFCCDVIIPTVSSTNIDSWSGAAHNSFKIHGQKLWIPVICDAQYVLQVKLKQLNYPKTNNYIPKAYAPKFSKSKDEGWILILGDPDNQEVLAIKRIPMIRQSVTKVTLTFFSPERPGRYMFKLYVMSDSYMSLDQELPIHIDVRESCE